MKTMKILFTLVVFVMMGLTVSAQTKKDTTVIFKVGIHCPSCKAKLDKDTDKNSVEALRAAIERHDVKVVGMCDKDGKLIKCGKAHNCCKEGNKEACKGSCGEKHNCSGTCGQSCGEKKCDGKCDQNCESKESKCEGKCGDNCCSKTGKTDECCKNKKK